MKPWILLPLLALLLLAGCASEKLPADGSDTAQEPGYYAITQEEARRMMAEAEGWLLVDVRRQDEYAAGHIPGAILVPNESIGTEQPEALPDLDQILLIYCRSGRRSKEAAQKLAAIGYTKVYEFGGILDWTGDVITADITFERDGEESLGVKMILKINETEVPVLWEDNESVAALKGLLPLTIQMSPYGGFEQVGSIGQSIVRDDRQITTSAGDIVLYSGNQLVVFYGSNSWAYTRLGHVELPEEGLTALLENSDVTITVSIEQAF